jgi:SAM-dependent methyltransferase
MKNATERFYDAFSTQIVRDYVRGNRRVERQLAFLRFAIPSTVARVLVIGCGAGESARFIAARVARGSEVVGLDISGENLRLARALHAHSRVTYKQLDVLVEPLDGTFDVAVLPDVYEHIPLSLRGSLHDKLNRVLTTNGRLLLTIPSPAKQAALTAAGRGLQIIDEVVTVQDLMNLARDVGGELTYLNLISVWEANDYIHAAITRGSSSVAPLNTSTRLSLQPEGVLDPLRRRIRIDSATRLVRAGFRYVNLRVRLRRMGGLASIGAETEARRNGAD